MGTVQLNILLGSLPVYSPLNILGCVNFITCEHFIALYSFIERNTCQRTLLGLGLEIYNMKITYLLYLILVPFYDLRNIFYQFLSCTIIQLKGSTTENNFR